MHGLAYERPAAHTREYLELLAAARDSVDGQVAYEGELFRANGLYGTPETNIGPILVGALGTVALVQLAGIHELGDGAVGETALAAGRAKAELGWAEAVARGVLCNALVCLAVWLAIGGRSVTDKILGVLFPVAAFVTVGFEQRE